MGESMSLDFLKPKILNVILTLIILALPLFSENVPLSDDGPYVVERYSPLFLLIGYIILLDFYALFLMICFSLLIYISVCAIIKVFSTSWRRKRFNQFTGSYKKL